jgi:hypothetical protein
VEYPTTRRLDASVRFTLRQRRLRVEITPDRHDLPAPGRRAAAVPP